MLVSNGLNTTYTFGNRLLGKLPQNALMGIFDRKLDGKANDSSDHEKHLSISYIFLNLN